MMLTKRALKAKTIEELIDAVASMCKRNAVSEFNRLGFYGKPHITHPADGPVTRSILPMTELIGSLLNINGDTNILEILKKQYYDRGRTLQDLLNSINGGKIYDYSDGFGSLTFLDSLNKPGHVLSPKFSNDPMSIIGKNIKNLVVSIRDRGIEPNDYLPQIKMDIIQEAYVGRLP